MTVIDFVCRQATGLTLDALVLFYKIESSTERQVREWATKMMLRKTWKKI